MQPRFELMYTLLISQGLLFVKITDKTPTTGTLTTGVRLVTTEVSVSPATTSEMGASSETKEDSGNKDNLYIAGGVGGAVAVLLVSGLIVVIVLLKRRSIEHEEEEMKNSQEMITSNQISGVQLVRTIGMGKELLMLIFRPLWNRLSRFLERTTSCCEIRETRFRDKKRSCHFEVKFMLLITPSSVSHPNCVKFFGCYIKSDTIYIVMEFMKDGSLKDLLSTAMKNGNLFSERQMMFMCAFKE